MVPYHFSVVLYCNFRSLAFLGLLGFLTRQLKVKFIATLHSAAKILACLGNIMGGARELRAHTEGLCNFPDIHYPYSG